MNPLYALVQYNIKFLWNIEQETLFQHIKTSNRKDVTLTMPNKNHPTFVTVDSSLIGIGCVLIQKKRKTSFYNLHFSQFY